MQNKPKNINSTLDSNYIVLAYLKVVFPFWKADMNKLKDVIDILGKDLMTKIQTDCVIIKQYCIENHDVLLAQQILEKAMIFRKDNEIILKTLQNQI